MIGIEISNIFIAYVQVYIVEVFIGRALWIINDSSFSLQYAKIMRCLWSNRINFGFRFHLHKSLEMWGFIMDSASFQVNARCSLHSEPMMRFSVGFDAFVIRSQIEMHFGGWDIIVVRFQLAVVMARRLSWFLFRRRFRYINVLLIKYLNRGTSMKCGTMCSLIFGFFLIRMNRHSH